MNILVIGSEGFIGSFMTKALEEKGHAVTGMDLPAPGIRNGNYKYLQGDIMRPDDLARAMNGIDLVINLAAKHHDFGISRQEYFEINEDGTRNILDAMSNKGIKKFIFYSSVAVYGDVQECSHEGMPTNPANDYGESKLSAERLIMNWVVRDLSRAAVLVRPAVVFGPNNYANMYKLIDTIYKRRYVQVGKGDNIKSACYVENLVDMTLFLMERISPGVAVYNYSDYEHLTAKQIVDIIHRALGRTSVGWHVPLGPVLAATSIVDLLAQITKINFPITAKRIKKLNSRTWHGSDKVRELGFKQRVTLEEGFERMVRWYLNSAKSKEQRAQGKE